MTPSGSPRGRGLGEWSGCGLALLVIAAIGALVSLLTQWLLAR